MRFDEHRSIYRDCRWCAGRGCLYCASEAKKAYETAFPNGPTPIATFNLSNPDDVAAARQSIGAEAITKAFSSGGRGIAEVIENIAKAKRGHET
jgi:hypothetical protein